MTYLAIMNCMSVIPTNAFPDARTRALTTPLLPSTGPNGVTSIPPLLTPPL